MADKMVDTTVEKKVETTVEKMAASMVDKMVGKMVVSLADKLVVTLAVLTGRLWVDWWAGLLVDTTAVSKVALKADNLVAVMVD